MKILIETNDTTILTTPEKAEDIVNEMLCDICERKFTIQKVEDGATISSLDSVLVETPGTVKKPSSPTKTETKKDGRGKKIEPGGPTAKLYEHLGLGEEKGITVKVLQTTTGLERKQLDNALRNGMGRGEVGCTTTKPKLYFLKKSTKKKETNIVRETHSCGCRAGCLVYNKGNPETEDICNPNEEHPDCLACSWGWGNG